MNTVKIIESFSIVSLVITFALIILLVYHVKQRLNSMEQKCDTMFDIVQNVVSEMNIVKSSCDYMTNAPSPPKCPMTKSISGSGLEILDARTTDKDFVLSCTRGVVGEYYNCGINDSNNEEESDKSDEEESDSEPMQTIEINEFDNSVENADNVDAVTSLLVENDDNIIDFDAPVEIGNAIPQPDEIVVRKLSDTNYKRMSISQLKKMAEDASLTIPPKATKSELIRLFIPT